MRSLGWALTQYDSCFYKRETFGCRHTQRMSYKDEGRNQGDASTDQEMPKIAIKPPEARRKVQNGSFLTASRRDQPCGRHDLGLPAFRTVRQPVSVISAVQPVVLSHGSFSKRVIYVLVGFDIHRTDTIEMLQNSEPWHSFPPIPRSRHDTSYAKTLGRTFWSVQYLDMVHVGSIYTIEVCTRCNTDQALIARFVGRLTRLKDVVEKIAVEHIQCHVSRLWLLGRERHKTTENCSPIQQYIQKLIRVSKNSRL